MNSQTYLELAIEKFRPHFKESGITLPKNITASMGWTSHGIGTKDKWVQAEAWAKMVSRDRANYIFISPKVHDTVELLTVLAHELCHVVLDCNDGHGQYFQSVASQIGLVKPWEQAVGTTEFNTLMGVWHRELGDYPHAGFRLNSKAYGTKQKSYSIRLNCPVHTDYIVRTSRTQINKGLPSCYCGKSLEESKW